MDRMVHRLLRFIAAFIMGAVICSLAVSPAEADESSGPIAVDDAIQVYPGTFKTIDLMLLANDSHPEGTHIWICGIKPIDKSIYFGYADTYTFSEEGRLNSTVSLSTFFDVTAENVLLTYALCDGEHTSWASVDVDIVYPQQPVVKKTKRPGRIKFINPNDDFLTCGYGNFNEYQPDGWVEVAANSSEVVRVHRRKIDWLCFIGYDWGYAGEGTLRNITLAQRSLQSTPRQSTNPTLNQFWREHVS